MAEGEPPPQQDDKEIDPYAILGVTERTRITEIKAVYNRLARESYPGSRANVGRSDAEKAELQRRYDLLGEAYAKLTESREDPYAQKSKINDSSSPRPDA